MSTRQAESLLEMVDALGPCRNCFTDCGCCPDVMRSHVLGLDSKVETAHRNLHEETQAMVEELAREVQARESAEKLVLSAREEVEWAISYVSTGKGGKVWTEELSAGLSRARAILAGAETDE